MTGSRQARPGLPVEVDVVVVGAGGAGMAAALRAADLGLDTVLLEKSAYFGGSTARSGGGVWIPGNDALRAAGQVEPDDLERSKLYLDSIVGDDVPKVRRDTYLERGPEVLSFITARTPVRFAWVPQYADYHPEQPGGRAAGRSVEPVPLDARFLGDELERLHPAYTKAPANLIVTQADFRKISLGLRTVKGPITMAKVLLRRLVSMARGRKMYAMGNALAIGLRQGLVDAGVPVHYETELTDLVIENGRVVGVTVLRDGKVVARFARGGADEKTLIRAMVGRDIERAFPERPRRSGAGEEKLRVENLSYARAGRAAGPISFTVREGEILGIAGLVGAGRTELLEAIFGLRHKNSGRVWIEGWETEIRDARAAVRAGLAFVSEDRKGTGLVLDESVRSNVTLASLERFSKAGWVDRPREREAAREFTGKLRIKTPGIETPAGALSGGNQQKIVLAKWLLCRPKVLLCDEPTRGIDVGAKAEIYSLLRGLADGGMAVVLVSSELPEILGLSDRILVLSDGKAAGTFPAEGTSEETLLEAMTSAFR